MMIRIKYSYEIPYKAVIADYYVMICYNSCPGIDKDPFAENQGRILGCADFDRHRLAAQKQAAACNRSSGEDDRTHAVHSYHGGSGTGTAKLGRGPQAEGHVEKPDH
ncbi:hypothetical protein [Hyphomicrobium sp.]|jgi:hypothetical protein|uniref:hypothetical protein n=1 Tax=Hyphomicrobium sp. TaxID=82 RepID=UPI003561324A